MEAEIKMQAYLVWKCNYNIGLVSYFYRIGQISSLKIWEELIIHYNQGKRTPSYFPWNLEDVMHIPVETTQKLNLDEQIKIAYSS